MPLILDGTTGASLIATTAIPASVVLSTPASGTMTNVTSVPAAQLTGTVAVANGGTGVTSSTGSGANVLGTSPTLTTPTFNSAQLAAVNGTAPLFMCRAWANFNGQGTPAINSSGNVSSITDNGLGDYTVNFTTAMPHGNYVLSGTSGLNDNQNQYIALKESIAIATSMTTTTCRVVSQYGNLARNLDPSYVGVCFIA